MAGGAGHMMDAINKMKQSRTSKSSQRNRFKEDTRETFYSKKENQDVSFWQNEKNRKASQESIEKIKKNVQIECQKRNQMKFISGVTAVVIFLLIYFLV